MIRIIRKVIKYILATQQNKIIKDKITVVNS